MTNHSTYELRRRLALTHSKSFFGTPEELERARGYENQSQIPKSWYFQKFNRGKNN